MISSLFATMSAYGRQLATEHVELKTYVLGGASEIMAASRSELTYPVLWQEVPPIEPADNGAGFVSAVRPCAFIVLDQLGDETEEQVYARTEVIALDLLARLVQDRKLREFGFDLNQVKVEPLSSLFFDNERGWRISFPLTAGLDLTYDPTRWN